MQRIWSICKLLFLIVFVSGGLYFLQPKSVSAQVCPGVGNYCYGKAVVQIPNGCIYDAVDDKRCETNWVKDSFGKIMNFEFDCNMTTCTWAGITNHIDIGDVCVDDGGAPIAGTKPPVCAAEDWYQSLSCCYYGSGIPPVGGCTTTPPWGLTIYRYVSDTDINITWNRGTGGNTGLSGQVLVVSKDPLAAQANCSEGGYTAADCVVLEFLPDSANSYSVPKNRFADNTVYYFKVIERAGACSVSTTKSWLSTCELIPPSWTFPAPSRTRLFTVPLVDILYSAQALQRVNFSTSNPAVVSSVNPAVVNDTVAVNEVFSTTATSGLTRGLNAYVIARVYLTASGYGTWKDCTEVHRYRLQISIHLPGGRLLGEM